MYGTKQIDKWCKFAIVSNKNLIHASGQNMETQLNIGLSKNSFAELSFFKTVKYFEGTYLEMRKAATKIQKMEFQYYLMISQFKRQHKNMR